MIIKDKIYKTLSIFLSIIVALYLLEIFFLVTDIDKKNFNSKFFKQYNSIKKNIEYDDRNLFEFYSDYKKKNKEVVLAISPLGIDPLFTSASGKKIYPLSNISNKENILCNENGYYSKFLSDNYGFNNPFVWQKEIEYEYILLGDSYVEGYCVDEKNNIAGTLKKFLNKESIINLGHGGNGPLKNYATLKEYSNLIKTKKILYFYTEANDLNDLEVELKNPVLKKYLEDEMYTQKLSGLHEEIDKNLIEKVEKTKIKYLNNISKQKNNFIKHIKFHRVIRFKNKISRQLKKPNKKKTKNELIKNEFKNILNLIKEFALKKNVELYFVYIPTYRGYKENIVNINTDHYISILKLVNSLNIPIIDLREKLFDKNYDLLSLISLRTFGHYNKKGYHLISKIIFKETN